MIGLLFIAFLVLWILFCWWLTSKITQRNPNKSWRPAAKVGLFMLLLSSIVIDEIIAAPQYAYLCWKNAHLVLDDKQPQGKVAWFDRLERKSTYAWPLSIEVRTKWHVDIHSYKPIYHYRTVNVKGGFFIRGLGIFGSNNPLLFDGSCVPKEFSNLDVWRKQYGITVIPRPV